jgi:hypothetical protein
VAAALSRCGLVEVGSGQFLFFEKVWHRLKATRHRGPNNDLLRGRASRFSLDALVNICTALGCRVRMDLEAD